MQMSNFKKLLFDADDTLLDFKVGEEEALKLVFQEYGYPFNHEIANSYERINMELWRQFEQGKIDRDTVIYSRFGLLFQEIGVQDDGIAFEDCYQELLGMQHFLIDGAIDLVERLSKDYDLYIVTNGVTRTQLRRLKDSGLDRYMRRIFVSEETGYQKPKMEFFDYCFARIPEFDPSKALIIGDSLSSDIRGGNNAGIATCWFNPMKVKNTSDVVIDYEIEKLSQIYDILGITS
jgi:2-haloacid dehalogenase